MGKYTSYYLYQKYEKIGSQDWTPVYPQTLSVYSDGTESGSTVIKSDNDTACGYKPSTEVQYRWVKLNPSTDYICDNCELWVSSGYICDNGDLYEQLNEQNFDGKNWYYTGTKKKGKLIEKDSKKCTGDTGTTTGGTTGSTIGSREMKVTYTDDTSKIFTGLTSIEKDTDSNKANAKEVVIGNGVKSIGGYAFAYCSSLTGVTLPDTLISIGHDGFAVCSSLTGVTLPDTLISIGDDAFGYCTSLTSVTIPNSVTSIGNYAFYKCINLQSINIPTGITSIGRNAFVGCKSLRTMTVQASTPPTLGSDAFANSDIQTIYVPASSVNDYKSADGWKNYADKIEAIGTTTGSMKVTYTDDTSKIFTGLTSIEADTDSNKSNAKEVEIYDGVTIIGEEAFSDCTSLTSIAIPDTVKTIGENAFCHCSSLNSVTIPSNIRYIGDYAFKNCSGLTTITVKAATPPTLGDDAFDNSGIQTIYVPSASVDAYKSADGWKDYANSIQAI